jgi:hypothetical protein
MISVKIAGKKILLTVRWQTARLWAVLLTVRGQQSDDFWQDAGRRVLLALR